MMQVLNGDDNVVRENGRSEGFRQKPKSTINVYMLI